MCIGEVGAALDEVSGVPTAPRRTRSHKYFENLAPYGNAITPDHPEFAAQARARIGGPYEHLVQPEKAQFLGDPNEAFTLRGFHAGEGVDAQQMLERLSRAGVSSPPVEELQGKQVYGIGSGANPTTWSHEFRHEEVKNEFGNRAKDVAFSPSMQAYQHNIRAAHDLLVREGRLKDHPYSFAEKEQEVLRRLPGYVDGTQYLVPDQLDANQGNPRWGRQLSEAIVPRMTATAQAKNNANFPFLMWMGKDSQPPMGHSYPLTSAKEVIPPRTKETIR